MARIYSTADGGLARLQRNEAKLEATGLALVRMHLSRICDIGFLGSDFASFPRQPLN
jgi:hypothetical protein